MKSISLSVRRACCMLAAATVASLFSLLYAVAIVPSSVAQAQDTAYVRVIHASPFVGTADIFVDGKALLNSFQFAAVTDYVEVPAGVHKVQISLIGKGIGASVVNQDLTVQPGVTYTVAALGASADKLSLQAFVDDNQITPNQSKVRFYHLSPDASSVNVTVGDGAKFSGLGYAQNSDYVTVNPGSCTFTVTNTQSNITKQLTWDLKADTITSVFSVGLFKGNPSIQLVSARASGVPGLPKTGSYPVQHDSVKPATDWVFAAIALALVGVGVVISHQRQRRRA